MDDSPPVTPRLLFALWLSDIVVFIGLLCEMGGGVLSAKLVMSSRCAIWLGAATKSSFSMKRWRELPPSSGDISASCMSMSLSWQGKALPLISVERWGCGVTFTPSSSSLESVISVLRLLPLLDLLGWSLVPLGSPGLARLPVVSPPLAPLGPCSADWRSAPSSSALVLLELLGGRLLGHSRCFSALIVSLVPLLVSLPVLRVVLSLFRRGISNLGVSVAGVLWECCMVSSGLGAMVV